METSIKASRKALAFHWKREWRSISSSKRIELLPMKIAQIQKLADLGFASRQHELGFGFEGRRAH